MGFHDGIDMMIEEQQPSATIMAVCRRAEKMGGDGVSGGCFFRYDVVP